MEFNPEIHKKPEAQPLYGLQTGNVPKEDIPEDSIFQPLYGLQIPNSPTNPPKIKPELPEVLPDSPDEEGPKVTPLYAVQFDPEPSNVPHPEPVYGIQFGPTNIPDLPDSPIDRNPKAEPLYAVQFGPAFKIPDKKPDVPLQIPNIEEMPKEELIELLKKILAGLLKNE